MDDIYEEEGELMNEEVNDNAKQFLHTQEVETKEIPHKKKNQTIETNRELQSTTLPKQGGVVSIIYALVY